MTSRLAGLVRSTLYPVTLLLGLLLLPLAVPLRRVGVTLPVHRALEGLDPEPETDR